MFYNQFRISDSLTLPKGEAPSGRQVDSMAFGLEISTSTAEQD